MPIGVYKRKPISEETRRKMRLAQIGHHRGGWKMSEEIRRKLSKLKEGVKHSFEHNKSVSLAKRGKKFSEEHKIKLSEARKRYFATGVKPHNYIYDRSKLVRQEERGGPRHKDWSLSVKKRDSWKCKINNNDCSGRIEAHHILGWTEYPELRYNINNGITLCHAHHPRKRAEEKLLVPKFRELIGVSI